MGKSWRRFLMSTAMFILAISYASPAHADGPACGFCDDVCYDSTEYGIAICTQRCGVPSGPAECDWEPNPCLTGEWNVCPAI